ncbi:Biotin carboxyl carrier protein of acetyl-CoA carboxylase [uncultured Clostridium sp.]|uniref:acetyl-CoA carboxylase biotin carboxyl carrier protein n=1 Tax=uncultured Clostridium sp. TaxID=59620 RepID=UPI000821D3F6|nr:acetyl-CoA carboxylase biotin carboxyl carrier protein [uncultured Clostridium sp.]SCJ47558.1 Biotin carboxyl carrier protein of acetyl-CoA carboxylase [uncultured Clostridium sp.]
MLDYNKIKELINEIDSSSIRVFELENDGFKLKLSKNDEAKAREISRREESKQDEIDFKTTTKRELKEVVVEDEINNSVDIDLKEVKSPLVGTFYSSSTPGGKPYVEIGSKVKKGDVLCIVEAMKIMNEVTSDFDGEIIEILRKDEDIVEFGMTIFKIK